MPETQDKAQNLIADLRKIEELIDQVDAALTEQRELLLRRRLAMPAPVLESFERLKQEFQKLRKRCPRRTDRAAAAARFSRYVHPHHHFAGC